MPFIGNKPSAVPLTSADIADGIITSAKIVDATIANADIANSTINLTTKVTGSLPFANGGTGLTALGTAGQALVVNSGATALQYSTVGATAGQVIQVVTATDSTERATTSTSYAAVSQLSLSITPSSASNKILILVGSGIHTYAPNGAHWTVYRGSTNLATGTSKSAFAFHRYAGTGGYNSTLCIAYLDSPATTSATTYQVYQKTDTTSAYINIENTTGSITALEIKG